jgi:hypothetical protein
MGNEEKQGVSFTSNGSKVIPLLHNVPTMDKFSPSGGTPFLCTLVWLVGGQLVSKSSSIVPEPQFKKLLDLFPGGLPPRLPEQRQPPAGPHL